MPRKSARKAFLDAIATYPKTKVNKLLRLCAKASESNIERCRLVIYLAKYYAPIYAAEQAKERSGERTEFSKSFLRDRRLPITLPSYICKIHSLPEFPKRTISAFKILYENIGSIEFFANHCFYYPDEYDLSQERFNLFLKNNVHNQASPAISEEEDEDEEQNKKPVAALSEPSFTLPEEENVQIEKEPPNLYTYDEEQFNVPYPSPNDRFVISNLGENTFNGHAKVIGAIKKRHQHYNWPSEIPPLSDDSPFLFNCEQYDMDKFCPDTVNLLEKKQIENFSHTFNPFYRERIEPYFQVRNIFVAENRLHTYENKKKEKRNRNGCGFFMILSNGHIFHACVTCSNVNIEDYKP